MREVCGIPFKLVHVTEDLKKKKTHPNSIFLLVIDELAAAPTAHEQLHHILGILGKRQPRDIDGLLRKSLNEVMRQNLLHCWAYSNIFD